MKELIEKRNDLVTEMENLVASAKTETRALTEAENTKFEEMKKEVESIDKTIEKEEELENMDTKEVKNESNTRSIEEIEKIQFENCVRSIISERAEENTTYAENGAVVPTTIANKIIDKVVEICPIFSMAERYNMKGDLILPVYDAENSSISMEYADEFSEAEGKKVKFASIKLTGYLGRALAKISKSLINNSKFDIVDFVINKMAQAISKFIEKELLNGTEGKIDGLNGIVEENIVTVTTLDSDSLIDLQDKIIDNYQADSIFIMNRNTRNKIRKFKDNDKNYMLNKDLSAKWGYVLLGKDVYTTDAIADDVIFYGDMSGLAVKVSEEINMQILKEKYAEQHVTGVLGFVELDSKVQDTQKLAKLVVNAG